MKILKKSKGSKLYGTDAPVISWAETNPAKFAKMAKRAKFEGRRAPELWVRDGESRLLRFVDDEPVVAFQVYRLGVAQKFAKYVKPIDGKPDLFASVLGLRPSRMFVWRVIDIAGYTNKQGKEVTNLPRFYCVSARQYEQITQLKRDAEMPLRKFNIKLSRSGTASNTTYSFYAKQPSPITPDMQKAIAQFPKWEEYYHPPTTQEQQTLVQSMGASVTDEDDDEG